MKKLLILSIIALASAYSADLFGKACCKTIFKSGGLKVACENDRWMCWGTEWNCGLKCP